MAYKNKKWLTKKKLLIIIPLLVIAALAVSEATNTTHIFHKAPALKKDSTSNSAANGNSKSSGGSNKNAGSQQSSGPASTTGQGVNQTAASDTNGQSSATTSPSQWATSASGLITLKSPVANSTFKSGGTISGTAKVSKVWYRLVDDSSGVISQGQPLSVVNGKFSGTLGFHAYGSSGHLDIFSYSSSGAEVNEINVPLKF